MIGSLNGVHMFANTHDVQLLSTVTDDSKIIWKVFHDSLTMILITDDDQADNCHLNHILTLVFDAMVLLCGQDELINIKNVERFKKDIKVCYPIVDKFVEQPDRMTFGDLTNAVDVIVAPENNVLQNFLDAFTEAADSPYGCLFVHGKVAVATKKWWSLAGKELVLISMLLSSLIPCSSRDVPIFLPVVSPNVPYRLLTFQLTRHVEVCVLCGPTTHLTEQEQEVSRFWRTSYDLLRTLLQLHPRNFPGSIELDANLLGFILVNVESNKVLSSVSPHEDEVSPDESMPRKKRHHILRSFYKHVVGTYFSSKVEGSEKGKSEFTHVAMETYITTDTHKCYAMLSPPHQMYALYNTTVPTFAMRSVTEKTLKAFTKDKNIHV